jgi:hypothetical protein
VDARYDPNIAAVISGVTGIYHVAVSYDIYRTGWQRQR